MVISNKKTKQTDTVTGVSGDVEVSDLLSLIPQEYIDTLAKDLKVDMWVKKLKADTLFKLVLFSILNSERLSLRVMEEACNDPLFHLLAPALGSDTVTWVAIRERLMKVDSAFFLGLYNRVYDQISKLYSKKTLNGYHIRRYDSTMVAQFAHLLSGMKVGNTSKNKTQIKFTTQFVDDFLIAMEVHTDQEHLSEEIALKECIDHAPVDNDTITVFDKGLKSRKSFSNFSENNRLFVTRIHETPRYDLICPIMTDTGGQDMDDLEFIQDSWVYLYETGHKRCETRFRLVQYKLLAGKHKGKILSFLTNIEDLSCAAIAGIYRNRWEIEVLFRFMKQEMNLTHFVCNDINAIKSMMYCTLILSMLILVFKQQNHIKSYKFAKIRFLRQLTYDLMADILDDPDALEHFKKVINNLRKKDKHNSS
jgi:Transposase DDE domain